MKINDDDSIGTDEDEDAARRTIVIIIIWTHNGALGRFSTENAHQNASARTCRQKHVSRGCLFAGSLASLATTGHGQAQEIWPLADAHVSVTWAESASLASIYHQRPSDNGH